MYKLVIANRNYSSWSLRAWLFLRESSVPFEEIRIPMFTQFWLASSRVIIGVAPSAATTQIGASAVPWTLRLSRPLYT